MTLEKRIERLERRELATGEQRIRAVVICSTAEPIPTDEEIKIARAEFVELYGDPPGNVLINFVKGTTTGRVNFQYIVLPLSDRLKELRQKRIDSHKGIIPPHKTFLFR
jgi:uncharacterized coiled-coil protein SlyX